MVAEQAAKIAELLRRIPEAPEAEVVPIPGDEAPLPPVTADAAEEARVMDELRRWAADTGDEDRRVETADITAPGLEESMPGIASGGVEALGDVEEAVAEGSLSVDAAKSAGVLQRIGEIAFTR